MRTRTRVVGVVWLLAVVGALVAVWLSARTDGLLDLRIYRVGGRAWLEGVRLYAPQFPSPLDGPRFPFTYPPLAAALFSLVAVLPWLLSVLVWTAVGLALLTLVSVLTARRVEGVTADRALAVGLGATALSLALQPVYSTLSFGQINLLMMGLVAADCLLPRTRWPRGLLIGFAAAIKLTPLVFVLFFLPRKQFKPVLTAVASFVGFGLVGWAIAPTDTKEYWFGALLDPSRVGDLAFAANQSLRGVVHRTGLTGLAESAVWGVACLAVLVLVWLIVRRTHDDVVALVAVAIAGLLVSPVSWTHHWVWVVPGLIHLAHRSWKWAIPVALVFAIGPMTYLPMDGGRELHWSWWQVIAGNSYVLLGLAALVVLVRRR
ncbi:glycosyltransferase 87 family protein [Actinosynnema sp. NPDC020468]|uniref:glycosyltransferase 87 family protein n=1 Tax=Actinosynnema sp. NPDC020468 TaxID=3154488 RepID=UPI0033D47315